MAQQNLGRTVAADHSAPDALRASYHLDTSGYVGTFHTGQPAVAWSDLDPFTQGYIEALFEAAGLAIIDKWGEGEGEQDENWAGFSDLAPETLSRIIEDCAGGEWGGHSSAHGGREFWRSRQEGNQTPRHTPLNVTLGDDGKVRFQ
jgi:hypothetical protein